MPADPSRSANDSGHVVGGSLTRTWTTGIDAPQNTPRERDSETEPRPATSTRGARESRSRSTIRRRTNPPAHVGIGDSSPYAFAISLEMSQLHRSESPPGHGLRHDALWSWRSATSRAGFWSAENPKTARKTRAPKPGMDQGAQAQRFETVEEPFRGLFLADFAQRAPPTAVRSGCWGDRIWTWRRDRGGGRRCRPFRMGPVRDNAVDVCLREPFGLIQALQVGQFHPCGLGNRRLGPLQLLHAHPRLRRCLNDLAISGGFIAHTLDRRYQQG